MFEMQLLLNTSKNDKQQATLGFMPKLTWG